MWGRPPIYDDDEGVSSDAEGSNVTPTARSHASEHSRPPSSCCDLRMQMAPCSSTTNEPAPCNTTRRRSKSNNKPKRGRARKPPCAPAPQEDTSLLEGDDDDMDAEIMAVMARGPSPTAHAEEEEVRRRSATSLQRSRGLERRGSGSGGGGSGATVPARVHMTCTGATKVISLPQSCTRSELAAALHARFAPLPIAEVFWYVDESIVVATDETLPHILSLPTAPCLIVQ